MSAMKTSIKPTAVKLTAAALLLTAGLALSVPAARTLHADPTNGESREDTTVVHGTDRFYHVKYNGGQEGDVHVRADQDSDNAYLEVKVYDPHGNLVTRDFGTADHSPLCAFRVSSDYEWRQYTIKVVNLSYHSIPYDIHCY
jgi:uncharacterized protein (DUF1684 family)